MTVRRIIVLAMAAVLMAASVGSARQSKGGKPPAPPAVAADFRSDVGDKVAGDGAAYLPHNGAEGAFINSNGGLTIALQPAPAGPDRTMWFNFGGSPATDYGRCDRGLYLHTVASTNVVLQMNDGTSTTALGLLKLVVGRSYEGFGKINFYSGTSGDPYFWTLRFPPKSLTVTRVLAAEWTIEWAPTTSPTYAMLQCTTATKGRTVIADDSEWVMPFKITVTAVK
jgi:hypothetical protein